MNFSSYTFPLFVFFLSFFSFFLFFFLIFSPFPSKKKNQFEKKKHSQCVDGHNTKQLQVFIILNQMQ
jgi:NADH:ubiquinone oxidoreductase subunit 5 (subunit L)/multisubunit Na+/H+ antiporter MnhA subunit